MPPEIPRATALDTKNLRSHARALERLAEHPHTPSHVRINLASTYFLLDAHEKAQDCYLSMVREFITTSEPAMAKSLCEHVLSIYPENNTFTRLRKVTSALAHHKVESHKLETIARQFDFSNEAFLLVGEHEEGAPLAHSQSAKIHKRSTTFDEEISKQGLKELFAILDASHECHPGNRPPSDQTVSAKGTPMVEISIDIETDEHQVIELAEHKEALLGSDSQPALDAAPPKEQDGEKSTGSRTESKSTLLGTPNPFLEEGKPALPKKKRRKNKRTVRSKKQQAAPNSPAPELLSLAITTPARSPEPPIESSVSDAAQQVSFPSQEDPYAFLVTPGSARNSLLSPFDEEEQTRVSSFCAKGEGAPARDPSPTSREEDPFERDLAISSLELPAVNTQITGSPQPGEFESDATIVTDFSPPATGTGPQHDAQFDEFSFSDEPSIVRHFFSKPFEAPSAESDDEDLDFEDQETNIYSKLSPGAQRFFEDGDLITTTPRKTSAHSKRGRRQERSTGTGSDAPAPRFDSEHDALDRKKMRDRAFEDAKPRKAAYLEKLRERGVTGRTAGALKKLGADTDRALLLASYKPRPMDLGLLRKHEREIIGTMVGEYKINGLLGKGGMSTVYAGIHPMIDKRVAVKVIDVGPAHLQEAADRFIAEAKAVNAIGHPNIIDIFSMGQLPDNTQYLIMEYLEGMDLTDYLGIAGNLTYREAHTYFSQIISALKAAHNKGIVHRDLKPENIYLAHHPDGRFYVKLLDFGIAKFMQQGMNMSHTKTGIPMGTPLYMSPEQCAGKAVDHLTDIYALGVILYEMFTGVVPFDSESLLAVLTRHMAEPPFPPSKLVEMPDQLEKVILWCLEKNPANRPQSMDVLGEALLPLLEEIIGT